MHKLEQQMSYSINRYFIIEQTQLWRYFQQKWALKLKGLISARKIWLEITKAEEQLLKLNVDSTTARKMIPEFLCIQFND